MNANRLAAGILVVLVTSQTCRLVNAQNVEEPANMSVRGTNLSERDPLEVNVDADTYQDISFSNATIQAWSADESVGELPAPALPQDTSATAQFGSPPNTVLEGCCDPPCDNACPTLYGQVEALFLWRDSRLIGQPIVVDANTEAIFLSSSDLDSEFAPGVRATFGRRLCGGWVWEFSYFGLFQDGASARAVSPDPGAFLIFPDNFAGNVFVGMDLAQANYDSALNNFEMNLTCCCGCSNQCCDECGCEQPWSQSYEWLAGFRYINVDEELNILAQRTVGGATEEGSYDIRTDNDLYGLQLGARTRRMRGRFGWEATGKAGIFANDARQQQSVTDFPDFALRPTVSSSSTDVAFLGEANLSGLYQLNHAWNLRAGYTVLWIEGLALAPDQLDFDFASATGGSQLHNGGAILLHGINIGVEARW